MCISLSLQDCQHPVSLLGLISGYYLHGVQTRIPCTHLLAYLLKSSGKKCQKTLDELKLEWWLKWKPSNKKHHKSLDFLKLSWWLTWDNADFFAYLKEVKGKLQKTANKQRAAVKLYEMDWTLDRRGTGMYPYRLKQGDITILLGHRNPEGRIATARIEIGSLTCQTSLDQAYGDILCAFEMLGAELKREQVSEVHLAADFLGVDLQSVDVDNRFRWVSKSRSYKMIYKGMDLSYLSIGKGRLMCRIYDKVMELKDKKADHKKEVFADLWEFDEYDDKPVTRVEYQLRREALKTFAAKKYDAEEGVQQVGVDTFADLKLALSSLWVYCTDWCRQAKGVVDRKNNHQSKAKLSDFWIKVQSIDWGVGLDFKRVKPALHKNVDQLKKMARGCMMSAVAGVVKDIGNFNEILYQAWFVLKDSLTEFIEEDEGEFFDLMRVRRAELLVNTVPF